MQLRLTVALAVSLAMSGCGAGKAPESNVAQVAPGAPGETPFWAYSGKNGIGTSYEAYVDGAYSDDASTGTVSKVWFSLAEGVITETMYGLIHQAQLKDMQFVVKGNDFIATEKDDMDYEVDYLSKDDSGRPDALAYKVTMTDKQGRFSLEKHIFTDASGQALFVRAVFNTKRDDLNAYVVANPYINNDGVKDSATADTGYSQAFDENFALTLKVNDNTLPASVGFFGTSDGLTQLKQGELTTYTTTGEQSGNVVLTQPLGKLTGSNTFDITLGFGTTQADSLAQAERSLSRGYQAVLDEYVGVGDAIGWQDYLASLSELESLSAMTTDAGKLLSTSALVLKAQEDKTHAGALIASLSNPWGDTVKALEGHTGYKAVWVRDFYQVAMAFMAMGDFATAKTAFSYLDKVQVNDKTPGNRGDTGWFLQKTHVDGELEWVGVQLDQTAMPIMLAWKLYQHEQLSLAELTTWYNKMLKPAADFLVTGGKASILWNDTQITPPITQQERWEEQWGYSPSTTAAVIAGLVTASEIAALAKDEKAKDTYLATAKNYSSLIEQTMFTTQGSLPEEHTDKAYYFRIGQDADPNSATPLNDNNGRKGLDKKLILDGGFLELVRYGVRDAKDSHITATLDEYDNEDLPENLRVKYTFTFEGEKGSYPGFRRYGNDGYGEDEVTGTNYAEDGNNTPGQRGRVWPFFTGERGHYEIAALKASKGMLTDADKDALKNTYVRGMELFANDGMMLPEQVWDNVGVNPVGYTFGEGTNSATPLAWTHAEYVKLLRSLSDGAVWDHYPIVEKHIQ